MEQKINKIPLRDFHEPIVQPFAEVLKPDNDQAGLETIEMNPATEKQIDEVPQKDVHFAVTQEILEQNKHMESILIQIRDSLAAIENQQQEGLVSLSKRMLEYVSLVSRKLFGSSSFASVFSEVIQSRISNIVSNLSTASLVTIKLPKIEGGIKDNLVHAIKNTAGKLNIEIIEHADDEKRVEVGWESGKAEFDVEQTVTAVEQQVHKLDTTS